MEDRISPIETVGSTCAELTRLLDDRVLSCEELARETCRGFDAVGRRMNAVVATTPDRAARAGRAADAARSRGERGPLLGIPYGVKDIVDVAGTVTTCGSAALGDVAADVDAVVVARLETAGATLAAKLAVTELIGLATKDPSTSAVGPALNPWDRSRWAGGSSSGSAVAVALGLVPFAIGSETAGSIGAPAAWCGVTGLRPSSGRVSVMGVAPLAPSLDKVGVLARSAVDCAVVFAVLDESTTNSSCVDVSSLTVGYVVSDFEGCASAEMAQRHVEALVVIASVVQLVESPGLPSGLAYRETLDTIMYGEAWVSFGRLRDNGRLRLVEDEHARALLAGPPMDRDRYVRALRERDHITSRVAAMFDEVDVIVTTNFALPWPRPAIGQPWSPIPIREGNTAMVWASNLAGLPAVFLPIGLAEGLPVGLQFVGPVGSDVRLLELASAIQRESDWHRRLAPIEEAA